MGYFKEIPRGDGTGTSLLYRIGSAHMKDLSLDSFISEEISIQMADHEAAIEADIKALEQRMTSAMIKYNNQISEKIEQLEGATKIEIVTSLPAPSAQYRGVMKLRHNGGTDTLYICLMQKGEYKWVTWGTGGGDAPLYPTGTAAVLGRAVIGRMVLGQQYTPVEPDEPSEPGDNTSASTLDVATLDALILM